MRVNNFGCFATVDDMMTGFMIANAFRSPVYIKFEDRYYHIYPGGRTYLLTDSQVRRLLKSNYDRMKMEGE